MNEELQQYYNYLKQAKADVPDTFESFQSTLSDEGSAKQYYSYLREKGFDAPDTFDSFSNTLGLKKKGYSVESLEQGENPFQSIGIKSQPSSTPQPQLPSPEGVKPKTAKTFKDYLAAAGAVTGKAIQGFADYADYITTSANDALNQIVIGRKNAVAIKKMREEGTLAPALGGGIRPFEALSKAVGYTTQFAPPLPEETKKQRIVKGVIEGTAGVIPDVLASTLFPEIKTAQYLEKIGIPILSKFGMLLGTKEAIARTEEAEEGTPLQQVSAPMIGAMEGYLTGFTFDNLGAISHSIGERVASRVVPNVASSGQAINRALTQATGSTLSNAIFFGGYGNLEEYLRTGEISAETFATNAGMGMVLGSREIGKLMWAKGINSLIGSSKEAVNNAIQSKVSPEDLAKQAQEKIDAVESNVSTDKEKDVVDAFTLARASQMKAVADEVIKNPEEVRQSIEESTLDDKMKEAAIDKIDEIVHDNDPRTQALKPINDKIAEVDEKLARIKQNKALSEVEKEAQSLPLKEEKRILKEKGMAVYDEFESTREKAKQAGFDRIGNHWVGAKIPSSLESVQTTKKEGEKVVKEEGKRLPLEEKTEMDLQTPQKYTINKGSSDLPQAPELSKEDINWEESNWENIEDIGKIRLLETRGRNTKGQLVGTVRIIGKERGAETVEVVFNERSNKPILNRNTNLLGGGKGNAEQSKESTSLLKGEPVKENKDFATDNENFEGLSNRERNWVKFAEDLPRIMDEAFADQKPYKEAFLKRKGLTEEEFNALPKKQKDGLQKEWAESDELKELLNNRAGGQENAKSNGGGTEETGQQAQGLEQGEEGGLRVRGNEENRVEAREGEEVTPTKEQTSPSRSMYDKMEELHNSVQEAMEPVKEKKSILNQDTDLLGQEKEDAMNVVTPQERRRVGDVVKYKDKDGNILEGSFRGVAGNNQALIEHSESKNGIKYNATILRPMEEVEFPKTMPNDQMRAVDYALENNLYQEWIKEGRMTAQDAKIIIESAGLDVPSDISEIAQERGSRRTVRAKAEELRKFNEENGTLYNDFKEIFNQLREKDYFRTEGPCPK